MEESKLLNERKEQLLSFFKKDTRLLGILGLVISIIVGIYIRTRNLAGLRDVTTGNWTLGPDLDPFLFLRYAKEILADGSLPLVDLMRSVPLGFEYANELIFHSYLMVFFHKVFSVFGISSSIEQSAALFPVAMFALTCITFYLFVKQVSISTLGEKYSTLTAVIATFFLAITPQILPRTIAGIPEKEASGFFFMFLALYLFVLAWNSQTNLKKYLFSALAGLATAGMALVWGGYIFIILPISLALLAAFFLEKLSLEKIQISTIWIVVSYLFMMPFSTRYTLGNLLNSTTTLIPVAVITLFILHFILVKYDIHRKIPYLDKLPNTLSTLILIFVAGLLFALIFKGPTFIKDKFTDVIQPLISPIENRFGKTVAENAQPYFDGWAGGFGPVYFNIPLFFWLFFIGSIYVFYILTKPLDKKERILLTSSYSIFLTFLIFSRYSPSSLLNGENAFSIGLYLLGVIALVGSAYYVIHTRNKNNQQSTLQEIDFSLLLVFALFFFSIVSARGAVRLVMVLVPPAAIIVSYFIVSLLQTVQHSHKDDEKKLISIIILAVGVICLLLTAYSFYKSSIGTASYYVPSVYTEQWQYAMSWVRENTPTDAVFAHWWDYGYWVQSIGERATILDGGNYIVYWNYLIGRHVLTTPVFQPALNFLYTHKATHLLIDPTDIGKYSAFSTIGSDENYDRASYIPTMLRDAGQTLEKKNSTVYVYTSGSVIDADIIYNSNGTQIFLPAGKAGLAATLVEISSSGEMRQPQGVFIYSNKQYTIPLRYVFYNNKLHDFNSGLNAGVFVFPRVQQASGGINVDDKGASLYLSNRTVDSLLARLYLYESSNSNFIQVHSEEDFIVKQLKESSNYTSDFVFYDTFRGPIRIWQINYPSNMQIDETQLETEYPDERLWRVN